MPPKNKQLQKSPQWQPLRRAIYQTGELVPAGIGTPTKEEIRVHPNWYPITLEQTEEEQRETEKWLKEQDAKPDLCQTVIHQVTCVLRRHHDGQCSDGK